MPKPVVIHPEVVHPSPCAAWERDKSSDTSETATLHVPSGVVLVPSVVMSIGRNGGGAATVVVAVWVCTIEGEWHPMRTVATKNRIGMKLRISGTLNDAPHLPPLGGKAERRKDK